MGLDVYKRQALRPFPNCSVPPPPLPQRRRRSRSARTFQRIQPTTRPRDRAGRTSSGLLRVSVDTRQPRQSLQRPVPTTPETEIFGISATSLRRSRPLIGCADSTLARRALSTTARYHQLVGALDEAVGFALSLIHICQFGRASVLWGTRSAPCGSAPPGFPRRKRLGLERSAPG